MSKSLCFISVCLLMLFVMSCDCWVSNPSLKLEPQEIPFNADIRSIKTSVYDDCILLGMETGTIIRKDIANDVADTINAGNGRIYDMLEHRMNDTVSIFWVGVRDEGLVELWYDRYAQKIRGPKKHYPIPIKNTHYSVYAFDRVGEQLYIGTTAGFFRKPVDEQGRLELIADSFVVNKITHFKNMPIKSLFLATDKGLFAYYVNENRIEKISLNQENKEIISIHPEEGKNLYVLNVITDNKHFQKDILSGRVTLQKDFSADQVEFINYLHSTVDDHSWYVTNRKVIYKTGKEEIHYPILGSATRYNSLITKDYLFVPCVDKLLCFPLHEAIVEKKDDVMAISGWIGNKVYLITRDFKLYDYETASQKALKIRDLKDLKEEVLQLQATSGQLWFCSRKKLYRTDMNGNDLTTLLDCADYSNKEEIQSFQVVKGPNGKAVGVYAGLRGGFYYLSLEDRKQPGAWNMIEVLGDSLQNRDLFVNNIIIKDDQIYIATLNRGIFCGKLNRLDGFGYIPGSHRDSIGNPESMIFYKSGIKTDLCIHTNRGVYVYDEFAGAVRLYQDVGDKRLKSLLSGNENITYALKNKGMKKIPSDKDAFLFNDVAFRKWVFSANDNMVVCAGGSGLYQLDYDTEQMRRIGLEKAPDVVWLKHLIVVLLLVSGAGAMLFFFFRYRTLSIRLKRIEQDRLQDKNDSLNVAEELSPEQLKEIKEKLEELIFGIHLPNNQAKLKYELSRLFDKYFGVYPDFKKVGKTDKSLVMMLALVNYYRSQDVIDILKLKGKNKMPLDPNTIDQWRKDIRHRLQQLLQKRPEKSDMIQLMLDNLRSR